MALKDLITQARNIRLNNVISGLNSGTRSLSRASGVTDFLSGAYQNIANSPRAISAGVRAQVDPSFKPSQKDYQAYQAQKQGADRMFGSGVNQGKFQFTGSGAPKVALTAAGTLFPGAKIAAGLGAGLGAGFSALQGQNIAEGAGSGLAMGLQSNAVAGVTNPIISKFIPKGAGIAASRLIPAVANVGQGLLVDKATGQETTPTSVAIDLGVGLLGKQGQFETPKIGVAQNATPKQLKDLLPVAASDAKPLGGMIAPARSRLIKGVQTRLENGQYGIKIKVPEFVGDKKLAGKNIRFQVDPTNPNKLVRLGADGSYAGAFAGFEPEYDKDGKIVGVKFDPMKAGVGLAVAGGIKAVNGTRFPGQESSVDQTTTSKLGIPQQTPIEQPGVRKSVSPELEMGTAQSQKFASGEQTQLETRSQSLSSQSQPYFNTERLNIDSKGKNLIKTTLSEVKPSIEKVVGKKLSNKEVIAKANTTARVLNRAVSRDETETWTAALLKARQKLAALSQEGKVDQEYIDTLVTIKSLGSDIGRKLQSFGIGADAKMVTSKQAILEAVTKVEKDTEKILKAAEGVDFNDLKQSTAFYRKFVKPGIEEHLDLLRYNSMLSSPNTHINNAFSNYQGTGIIAPVEKTIAGGIDAIRSVFDGKPRTRFAGEGAAYAKGYYSNLKNAFTTFGNVMSGKTLMKAPDMRNIPLYAGGKEAKYEQVLAFPTKVLEATDQFFTTLTEAGVSSSLNYRQTKGIAKGMDVESMAADEAARRLFRSELGDNNGSLTLNALDIVANKVQSLKGSENPIIRTIAKYSLPFLRTPTNILKQGVEYTPFGLTTLPGSKDKTGQLAKTILGSSVGLAVATLVGGDRLTWAEPTGEKQKQAFKAAGLQAYSVKIGNKWWSYSKLHPAISFNFALVAAIRNAEENKTLDDGQIETLLQGAAKWVNFFADQSYVKNIGDIVSATKGDVEGLAKIPSNYVQQFVPFRALMGWAARLTDPYQRQVDPDGSFLEKQLGYLATQIPGFSQTVPARLDQFDNPIENQNRGINAISPLRVTTENPGAKEDYNFLKEKAKLQKDKNYLRTQLKRETNKIVTTNQVGASDSDYIQGKGLRKLDKQEKEKVDLYLEFGKPVSREDLENAYLGELSEMPSSNRYETSLKKKEFLSKLSTIKDDENLSIEQKAALKERIAKELNLEVPQLDNYVVASGSVDEKTLYAYDQLDQAGSFDDFMRYLVNGRRPLNGEILVSDDVIDNLVEDGLIPEALGDDIKDIKLNEDGKLKKKQGSGKKALTAKKNAIDSYASDLLKIKIDSPKIRATSGTKINTKALTFSGK